MSGQEREKHLLQQMLRETEFSDAVAATGGFRRMMALRKEGEVHNHDEDAMTDLTAVVMQVIEEESKGKIPDDRYHNLTGVVAMFLDAAYNLGVKRGEVK